MMHRRRSSKFGSSCSASWRLTGRRHREIATICRFNPRGDLIYVGTSKGNINIWDVQTKAVSPLRPSSSTRDSSTGGSSCGARISGPTRRLSTWNST
jgi:WD40 repeat protein